MILLILYTLGFIICSICLLRHPVKMGSLYLGEAIEVLFWAALWPLTLIAALFASDLTVWRRKG